MRVVIHDLELFNVDDKAVYDQLQRLFLRAYQGQHDIALAGSDFDGDIEQLLASDFMRVACATMHKAAWEELLRRTSVDPFTTCKQNRHVRVVRKSDPMAAIEVLAQDVGDWAEKPLRILLENKTDEILVHLAARLASDKLALAIENGWLESHGCGGTGEVKKAVERMAPGERIFVIIDSDREDSGTRMSATAQRISSSCAKAGVEIHVLERRELENYVPDGLWQLVVPPEKKSRRGNHRNQRMALVYSWILRQLDKNAESLSSKHGTEVLMKVRQEIERNATREVAPLVLREQLEYWSRMSTDEKAVDDLKERFGEGTAQKAVAQLSDENFDLQWLDEHAIKEFENVAKKIEEWL